MISKKYIVFLFCWLLGGICYASFPVESETIINNIDNANTKFDLLAFENVKRLNIFSRILVSINYLIWGDV